MPFPRSAAVAGTTLLALLGVADVEAQRARSGGAATLVAATVMPLPTRAHVAPTTLRFAAPSVAGGSASVDVGVGVVLDVADAGSYRVVVHPIVPTAGGGALRLLAGLEGTPLRPVAGAPAILADRAATGASPRPALPRATVHLRVEGEEAALHTALPLPVVVEVIARSGESETAYRVTALLRAPDAGAPRPGEPPSPSRRRRAARE